MIMIILIWVFILVIALVLYFRDVYSKFSKYGVKHIKPVPPFGNLFEVMTRKKHVGEQFNDLYFNYPEEKFVGRYEFTSPVVLIHDLELLKKITVKDFEHFLDRRSLVDENMDPLFGRNLFSLKSQEWKDMRSTLSPAFTSSKIRLMVPFMMEASDMMTRSLKLQIKESGVDYVDVDVRDLTSRYANDVIATCAFGLKVDSHTDKTNEFYMLGNITANFGFLRILKILGYISFPMLMKQLKVKLLSDTTTIFFRSIILNTMKEREKNNIIRPDMIHLLMEAKKGKLLHDEKSSATDAGFATVEESDVGQRQVFKDWSDDDLVAQAVLFFIAGFETVSTVMTFLLHELALHPDVQDRLVQEINEHEAKTGGRFDFNTIQSLTYLDMVISEVLRLWPPVVGLDRLCIKDYNLGKPNEKGHKDYIIRKGEAIIVPVWSYHRNPDFYPEPNKFDPERFSEENKHKIKPFTYLPFGLGPRNCIGSRFALCEIKVMAYQLLQHMKVSPAEKTQVYSTLATDTFNIRIKGGNWVRFRARI